MKTITMNAVLNINYDICFLDNIFARQNKALLAGRDANSKKCLVVVDSVVHSLYGSKITSYFSENVDDYSVLIVNGGELNKTHAGFLCIFEAINNYKINRRNEPVVIVGGGVVTDVAAFATSCYRRGVPHVKVPTTLMGYVDASVGIKTGINYGQDKNRMGSFYPPLMVGLDKTFIATQSNRAISNGMGEIIKMAVIKDKPLFDYLELHAAEIIESKFQSDLADYVLRQSVLDMHEELKPNLFEDQLERLMDFGHTFSLVFEMESQGTVLHGEAVAMDVLVSCQLAYQRKLLSLEELNRVASLMKLVDMTMNLDLIDPSMMWRSLTERVSHRNGLQRVPLPTAIGRGVFVNDLTYAEIHVACAAIHDVVNNGGK